MPRFRRTDSWRNYVGRLSTGNPVYVENFDIEQEMRNLYSEIDALKSLLNKKYDRLNELKIKLALKKQEEKHKKELENLRRDYLRKRRETIFLLNGVVPNNDNDDIDTVLAKSGEEHLNDLCNNNQEN